MGKRFYIEGKSTRSSDLTEAQMKREEVCQAERRNTAEWYRRMSGETPWKEGERESFLVRFDGFSQEIDGLSRRIAVEEFAAMTQGGENAGQSQKSIE